MNKKCCVLIYNSFRDPLIQNNMLPYVETVAQQLGWRFHLITFEQPEYAVSSEEAVRLAEDLRRRGITWCPRKHLTGKFLLAKKALNLLEIGFLLVRLRLGGTKVLWSYANVAASIGWVYSKLLHFKTIIYTFEPHSDFMKELGIWRANSLNYRILNALEWRAGRDADYVLTGTQHMVDTLGRFGVKGKVHRAPTCADHTKFYPVPNARTILPKHYSINPADFLIVYVGKFGGLYYTFEIFQLFSILTEQIPNCKCMVITPNPHDEIVELCRRANFDNKKLISVFRAGREDIKTWLSAADLGISAIPPTPSQKYRSPTKVAEYLMCGLPYLTVAGVSEDDIVAKSYDVGIVVRDFSVGSLLAAVPVVMNFLRRDRQEMSRRCREVGILYRGRHNVDRVLYQVFDELIKSV